MPVRVRADAVTSLENIDSFVTPQLKAQVGEYCVAKILDRTKRGIDFRGTGFAPYGAKYAAWRKIKKGLQTSTPDLFVSGQMLTALTHFDGKFNEVIVGFSDRRQMLKAHGHNYSIPRAQPRRFMGLDERDINNIKTMIVNAIKFGENK